MIKQGFNNIGYEIIDDLRKNALFDMSDFGVPQKRKRVIIIGVRRDNQSTDYQEILNQIYSLIHNLSTHQQTKTVRDAISDLPPLYPVENPTRTKAYTNDSSINGHSSRFHNERDKEIFKMLAKDLEEGTNKYTSTNALKKLYFEVTGRKSNVHKYFVLRWDEPSNTIPAHLKKDGLRHIHPDPSQSRSITVREAARLQTFDDDFMFNESQMNNFEMIGNAVPPLFAKKIGEIIPSILKLIKDMEKA